jgi:hypothetical protein
MADEDDDSELFKDWEPEFTVWLVRLGSNWPMKIDSVFVDEVTARKRATLLGKYWRVEEYTGLKPPKRVGAEHGA